jgi:hypothetical protein
VTEGRWYVIIVLKVHASREDTVNHEESYEELECMFGKFLKYLMKIFIGDFNAKVGREDFFNATIGNKSLH